MHTNIFTNNISYAILLAQHSTRPPGLVCSIRLRRPRLATTAADFRRSDRRFDEMDSVLCLWSNTASRLQPVQFDIPQGSVLGPLLYVLYTAEVSYVVARHGLQLHQYAVDTQDISASQSMTYRHTHGNPHTHGRPAILHWTTVTAVMTLYTELRYDMVMMVWCGLTDWVVMGRRSVDSDGVRNSTLLYSVVYDKCRLRQCVSFHRVWEDILHLHDDTGM